MKQFINVTVSPKRVTGMSSESKEVLLNSSFIIFLRLRAMNEYDVIITPDHNKLLTANCFGDSKVELAGITARINPDELK